MPYNVCSSFKQNYQNDDEDKTWCRHVHIIGDPEHWIEYFYVISTLSEAKTGDVARRVCRYKFDTTQHKSVVKFIYITNKINV